MLLVTNCCVLWICSQILPVIWAIELVHDSEHVALAQFMCHLKGAHRVHVGGNHWHTLVLPFAVSELKLPDSNKTIMYI